MSLPPHGPPASGETPRPIRIGFDASAIPPVRAGAGNYIFHLVRALADVDRVNDYVVFASPQSIREWGIDQPNFRFHAITASRPLRLLWEQTVLPFLIRRYELDVLHSPHYTVPFLPPARRVVTFLDMTFYLYPRMHSALKRFFFRSVIPLAARRADRIITISESTARDFSRFFPDPRLSKKVRPVPLAASLAYRPIADPAAISRVCRGFGVEPGRFILYVGVLEPRKNLPTLFQAYRMLLDGGVRHPLVVAGKRGWMFDAIFASAAALKLGNHVIFTDHVPDADLPCLYSGASVFVYPSVYEGFGLPVLEALACGVPVVTSNVSSLPEIADGAAVLVSPDDAGQIAGAIRRVLLEPEFAASLSRRGLERAASFSWDRTARETIEVYRQAVSG